VFCQDEPDEEWHAHEAQHREEIGDSEDQIVIDVRLARAGTSADESHAVPLSVAGRVFLSTLRAAFSS
jgi:hypothetical protein